MQDGERWGGLALTSIGLMTIGAGAALTTGSADPTRMLIGLGFGIPALLMMATITTNFVNIYLSALSFKTVFPRSNDTVSICSIGLLGTFFGVFNRDWLDWYARFMLMIGSVFIPLVGILLVEFFFNSRHRILRVQELYEHRGAYFFQGGVNLRAVTALLVGTGIYWLINRSFLSAWGATLPALAVTMLSYALLTRPEPS